MRENDVYKCYEIGKSIWIVFIEEKSGYNFNNIRVADLLSRACNNE